MMKDLDLIDGEEFIMLFHDIGGLVEIAFRGISADMRQRYGNVLMTTVPVRGLIGGERPKHRIGLILKLPNYAKTVPRG